MAEMIHLEELLSAYLDGELNPDELAHVARHLDRCRECIAEFREIQEARAAVRMLPRLELPARFQPEHEAAGEMLSAYLDGELSPGEDGMVVRHLEACPPCRDELQQLDAARTAVRSMPTLELPLDLRPSPAAHGRSVVAPDHRRHMERRRVAAWAASVAAMIALVVGVSTAQPPARPIDFTSIANQHSARDSVDSGFVGVPALAPVEVTE